MIKWIILLLEMDTAMMKQTTLTANMMVVTVVAKIIVQIALALEMS